MIITSIAVILITIMFMIIIIRYRNNALPAFPSLARSRPSVGAGSGAALAESGRSAAARADTVGPRHRPRSLIRDPPA